MDITWNMIWEAHPDLLIASNWIECPEDKKKENRLSPLYSYFMGGETTLRVGIVASASVLHEAEFLLSGVLWGNRLSNGAKTVIFFVAPDFSEVFLNSIAKIGGNITARAVYWREKLTPSLYLIPETQPGFQAPYSLGEERPNWERWGQSLNPVAQQQLKIVHNFFADLADRHVQIKVRHQQIVFCWGNFEFAEVRRKGKKFELNSKVKWLKQNELIMKWQKSGWVDASDLLDEEFRTAIWEVLDHLEALEQERKLRPQELLALWLQQENDVLHSNWGSPWPWPWLPKDRSENSVLELEEWFFFQREGQLKAICPILDKPLYRGAQSILLSSVLEKSRLLISAKDPQGNALTWDGRVHWLTSPALEEELRRWHSWLSAPDKFPIWTLPDDWQEKGIYELKCKAVSPQSTVRKGYS